MPGEGRKHIFESRSENDSLLPGHFSTWGNIVGGLTGRVQVLYFAAGEVKDWIRLTGVHSSGLATVSLDVCKG